MLWVSGCVVVSFRLGWLCKGVSVSSSPACGYSLCGRWVGEEGSFLVCMPLVGVDEEVLVVDKVCALRRAASTCGSQDLDFPSCSVYLW